MAMVHRQAFVSARLSPALRAALETEAARDGDGISGVVRAAVLDWLEQRALEKIDNEIES